MHMFFRSASEMQKHLVVHMAYRVGCSGFFDQVAPGVSSTPDPCLTLLRDHLLNFNITEGTLEPCCQSEEL